MASIFLSHNSADKEFVLKLAQKLALFDVRSWVDAFEILPGDSLIQKIEDGINQSDYLGAVISHNSADSEWVRRELRAAISDEIASRRIRVVPILLHKCEVPTFLRDKLYADFTGDFTTGFCQLLSRFVGSEIQGNVATAAVSRVLSNREILDPVARFREAIEREENRIEEERRAAAKFSRALFGRECLSTGIDAVVAAAEKATTTEARNSQGNAVATALDLTYECGLCGQPVLDRVRLGSKLAAAFSVAPDDPRISKLMDSIFNLDAAIWANGSENGLHDRSNPFCWLCYTHFMLGPVD